MSKTKAVLIIMMLVIGICSTVLALPKIGKGSDEGETSSSVDVSLLETSSLVLIYNASWATINILEASALIYEAIGQKEYAEKLRIGMETLTNNPEDEDSLKIVMEEANHAVKELNDMEDFKSNLNTATTFDVTAAFLALGCAINLDNNALETAKLIVDDSKTALQETPKTKVKEIKRIKAILESAVFLSKNIPVQLKGIATVSSNLVDLAKTKGVELPSQEKINEKASGMTRG